MKKQRLFIRIVAFVCMSVILFSVGCTNNQEQNESNVNTITFTDISLVQNAKSDYEIVLPGDATNYETYAAEELQLYLSQATGAKLNIVKDTARSFNKDDKVISVGQTSILTGSGVKVDYNELKRDGFVIKRLGNTLILCGGGGYGTLYAVYEFLRQEIEWEAYAVDEIYFKKNVNLKVVDFDFSDKPAIENRQGGWYAAASDAYFAAKWRTFAGVNNMLFNENIWYYYPHALFKLVNPEGYAAEHPDWYSSSLGQPCYSSAGFRAQYIENVKKVILDNPTICFIPAGPEDEDNATCTCADCLRDEELYGYSGLVVRWLNSAVEELEAWRVEMGIERQIYYPLLAYYETRQPPIKRGKEGVFEPIDESCVLNELSPVIYAPIEADFTKPIEDPDNLAAMNDLKGWLACSHKQMAYYYNNDFFKRFDWNDTIYSVTQNYGLAAKYNFMALGDDASNGALQGCAFQTMLGYIYAKVQWDPNVDTNLLVNNYINNYFKDAKEEVLQYYYQLKFNRIIARDNADLAGTLLDEKSMFNKGVLEQGRNLLYKGIEDIKNNPNYTEKEREKYISRVELELFTPLVYLLDYFSTDYTANTYLAMVDEMEMLVNKYGITHITASYSYSKTNEQKFAEWRGYKS